MNYTIKNGGFTYTVSTLGAQLISAKDESANEFIWQGNPDFWAGRAPLLFPVCGKDFINRSFGQKYRGKRYDMKIHGFLRRLEFNVSEYDEKHIILSASENAETLAEYPFKFTVTVSYTAEDCKLLSSYSVKNESEEVMPFAFGLHPGFNVFTHGGANVNDYRVIFDKTEAEIRTPISEYPNGPDFEDISLPSGEFKIDNDSIAAVDTIVFKKVGTHARLVCEKNTHEIDMTFSENLPVFCIWKHPSMSAEYLCLEPWSTIGLRAVTEENLDTRFGMIRLGVGKTEEFFCNFKFSL